MATGKQISQMQALEALSFDQLNEVTLDHVETAALGFAQYARLHFGSLLPVSSEQPDKVAKQVKDALQLDIPPIYACALASGSNWWETGAYTSSRGFSVTTAEADMMIEKAFFFYDKHIAACQVDSYKERDETIVKMLNAKQLHEKMHKEMPLDQIPKYARDPDRWPAFLKLLGRGLPFDVAWDIEWFEFQNEIFHASMQIRKLRSDCIFYKILSGALSVSPDIICAETNCDTKYGVGVKTEDALQMVSQGYSAADICKGGQNVLGHAHHKAAQCF